MTRTASSPKARRTGPSKPKRLVLRVILRHIETVLYVYDMGDHWEHEITVGRITDVPLRGERDPLAYLVGGARAAPPEDVGGPPGYENAIAALARRSPEDEETLVCLGPGFQPELFDQRAGNHALMLATAWSVI